MGEGSLSLFRVTYVCVLKGRVFEIHMQLEPSLKLPTFQGLLCPVLAALTSKAVFLNLCETDAL